jgi:hypothetical protein
VLELVPACPFKSLTGIDCPGCGATRAALALLDGDVLRAADHNLLLVVALPIVAVLAIWWLLARADRMRPLPRPAPQWVSYGIATVVALFWALRVLGPAPLTWLASDLTA